jgi:hypothetical protein
MLSNADTLVYFSMIRAKQNELAGGAASGFIGVPNQIGRDMYANTEAYLRRFVPFESEDRISHIRK